MRITYIHIAYFLKRWYNSKFVVFELLIEEEKSCPLYFLLIESYKWISKILHETVTAQNIQTRFP